MLLPRLPLIGRLLPAHGADYRTNGNHIERRLFGSVWYDAATCRSDAEAQRIAAQLNALR